MYSLICIYRIVNDNEVLGTRSPITKKLMLDPYFDSILVKSSGENKSDPVKAQ